MLASGGLLACQKDQATPSINQPFDLQLKQTATLTAGGNPVRITLTNVLDSRCPANVVCFQAGYAAVTLELTDASAGAQTARINLHFKNLPTYSLDSAAVTLNQQEYWLRLLDVNPYPGTNGRQPQTATLRLRPR